MQLKFASEKLSEFSKKTDNCLIKAIFEYEKLCFSEVFTSKSLESNEYCDKMNCFKNNF